VRRQRQAGRGPQLDHHDDDIDGLARRHVDGAVDVLDSPRVDVYDVDHDDHPPQQVRVPAGATFEWSLVEKSVEQSAGPPQKRPCVLLCTRS
jgi:hypothetical protein